MKLANDNLLEVFLFLCRSDLDSLHLVRRQLHVIIEEGLKRSCLRSIYCADILFHKDRNAFETRLKVDLYQDYVFTVQFDSIMAAMEQLLLLMKASFVEGLYFLDVELSEAIFACADKVGVYARVQEVYIECCDLSSTSERFVSTLIRR